MSSKREKRRAKRCRVLLERLALVTRYCGQRGLTLIQPTDNMADVGFLLNTGQYELRHDVDYQLGLGYKL